MSIKSNRIRIIMVICFLFLCLIGCKPSVLSEAESYQKESLAGPRLVDFGFYLDDVPTTANNELLPDKIIPWDRYILGFSGDDKIGRTKTSNGYNVASFQNYKGLFLKMVVLNTDTLNDAPSEVVLSGAHFAEYNCQGGEKVLIKGNDTRNEQKSYEFCKKDATGGSKYNGKKIYFAKISLKNIKDPNDSRSTEFKALVKWKKKNGGEFSAVRHLSDFKPSDPDHTGDDPVVTPAQDGDTIKYLLPGQPLTSDDHERATALEDNRYTVRLKLEPQQIATPGAAGIFSRAFRSFANFDAGKGSCYLNMTLQVTNQAVGVKFDPDQSFNMTQGIDLPYYKINIEDISIEQTMSGQSCKYYTSRLVDNSTRGGHFETEKREEDLKKIIFDQNIPNAHILNLQGRSITLTRSNKYTVNLSLNDDDDWLAYNTEASSFTAFSGFGTGNFATFYKIGSLLNAADATDGTVDLDVLIHIALDNGKIEGFLVLASIYRNTYKFVKSWQMLDITPRPRLLDRPPL